MKTETKTAHTAGPWKAIFPNTDWYGRIEQACITTASKSRPIFSFERASNSKMHVISEGFENSFSKEELERDFFTPEEIEANARLIAASPSLYAFAVAEARNGNEGAKSMLDSLSLPY